MNKYHQTLGRVLASGKAQTDREGSIHHLLNERPTLTPVDLLDIFEGHPITRKKLKNESQLFIQGERSVKKYHEADINWWSCCGSILVSGHPTYLGKLPSLIECTSRERCSSKNYALFLDSTNAESSQVSYLNLVQFQVEQRELVVMTYQHSSDTNLGLPADICHLYLMFQQIDLLPKPTMLNLGNMHTYENNTSRAEQLLAGNESIEFELNIW